MSKKIDEYFKNNYKCSKKNLVKEVLLIENI